MLHKDQSRNLSNPFFVFTSTTCSERVKHVLFSTEYSTNGTTWNSFNNYSTKNIYISSFLVVVISEATTIYAENHDQNFRLTSWQCFPSHVVSLSPTWLKSLFLITWDIRPWIASIDVLELKYHNMKVMVNWKTGTIECRDRVHITQGNVWCIFCSKCHVTLRHVMLRYVLLCYITLRYVTLCYVSLHVRYVMLRYVVRYLMLSYFTLCHVTLCC